MPKNQTKQRLVLGSAMLCIAVLNLMLAYEHSTQASIGIYALDRLLLLQSLGTLFSAVFGVYFFFFCRWRITGIFFFIASLAIGSLVLQIYFHL